MGPGALFYSSGLGLQLFAELSCRCTCLQPCLWLYFLEGPWTYAVGSLILVLSAGWTSQACAVASVLSLALSYFASDWTAWVDSGPGLLLALQLPSPNTSTWYWLPWSGIVGVDEGTACAGTPLAFGSSSIVGQSHSFCSLENIGKWDTAIMFLSGVSAHTKFGWRN